MQVFIAGENSPKTQVILDQIKWLIKELNLSRSRYRIEVIPFPRMAEKCGSVGITTKLSGKIGVAIDTSISFEHLMTAISHEMVHVKQFATGKLKYTKIGEIFWCGRKSMNRASSQPWELEAYRLQDPLTKKYLKEQIGL